MRLELVCWRKNRKWSAFHLTINDMYTLCGRRVQLGFGNRSIEPFSGDPLEYDLITCKTCTRIYETQQEFKNK